MRGRRGIVSFLEGTEGLPLRSEAGRSARSELVERGDDRVAFEVEHNHRRDRGQEVQLQARRSIVARLKQRFVEAVEQIFGRVRERVDVQFQALIEGSEVQSA